MLLILVLLRAITQRSEQDSCECSGLFDSVILGNSYHYTKTGSSVVD